MDLLKELTIEELTIVNGGNAIEEFAFFSGFLAGAALDFVHGTWDALMGYEKH